MKLLFTICWCRGGAWGQCCVLNGTHEATKPGEPGKEQTLAWEWEGAMEIWRVEERRRQASPRALERDPHHCEKGMAVGGAPWRGGGGPGDTPEPFYSPIPAININYKLDS